MKFPSVKYLTAQAEVSLKRFYLPLLISFIGAIIEIWIIRGSTPALMKWLFTCLVGLPLSLGCMLYAERSSRPALKWLMPLAATALLLAYRFLLAPDDIDSDLHRWLIFFVLNIVLHLWVAVAPYIGRDERQGFWRFNELLYTRMLLSLVFSGVLYAGLALALLACKVLFKMSIEWQTYTELWTLIMGVFNTWFFLSGIPADYEELNTEKLFPKGLKVFTQYILIPLVTLYMVILYAYCVKIIGLWSLPKGWVSTLILSYAVVGILAVLLVNPLRDSKDNAWVRLFSRFFFIATLPLIVLLYIAIWVRIRNYGITEPRYYLLIIGAWLGYIAVYFICSRQKNIKVIPLSLAIIGLLSLFGPWSVFSTSRRSQLHLLEHVLEHNGIWKPGTKVASATRAVSKKDAAAIRDEIDYFISRRDITAMQGIYAANLDTLSASFYKKESGYEWAARNDLKKKLFNMLCTNDYFDSRAYSSDSYCECSLIDTKGINIGGYTNMFDFSFSTYGRDTRLWIFPSPGDSLQVAWEEKGKMELLNFSRKGDVVQSINCSKFINALRTKAAGVSYLSLPQSDMTIDDSGALKIRLIIKSINLQKNDAN